MGYRDDDRPKRPTRPGSGDGSSRSSRPDRGDRPSRDDRPARDGGSRGDHPGRSDRFDGDRRPARAGSGDAERRPRRDDSRGQGRPARDNGGERPEYANSRRPVDVDRKRSPLVPDEIVEKDLEMGIRAQLKTLTPENAEKVARHLVMVGLLLDQDPELAHEHALAAADRAGRIAVVREIVGCTAYANGDFALALRELLTARRISGSNEQIALIVDSERGMGRPERALEVGRSVDRKTLSAQTRVNLAIALSGARLDQGENELALAELEIAELNPASVFDYSAPLFFAYADVLEILGRKADAKRWADLGDRAIAALEGTNEGEDENIVVLEEIEIPVRREWVDQEEWDKRMAAERGGERGPRRTDGDRAPRREFGERAPRRDFGDRPARDGERRAPRAEGERRPARDGERRAPRDGERSREDRPRRYEGDRPSGGTSRTNRDDHRPKRDS